MQLFDKYLSELPERYEDYKGHLERLASEPIADNEAELYPILQAGAFGGRQVSRYCDKWVTPGFRSYWLPKDASVRTSRVLPMHPRASELRRRVCEIVQSMRGVTCYHEDVVSVLDHDIPEKAVVYFDPPYKDTTGYMFGLDVNKFVNNFVNKFITGKCHLWVSEGYVMDSYGCSGFKTKQLFANRGTNLAGNRKKRLNDEYLNHYYAV